MCPRFLLVKTHHSLFTATLSLFSLFSSSFSISRVAVNGLPSRATPAQARGDSLRAQRPRRRRGIWAKPGRSSPRRSPLRDCRISAAIAPASREPCSGLALAPRLRAGWVAVRRGTREGEMALQALHLTQDLSLYYCAPFTTWATQRRSDEPLRGLGPSCGPSRAERRGASGASSPRPREGPGAEARPGRGPLKGRGFSALPMQRSTSPQAS